VLLAAVLQRPSRCPAWLPGILTDLAALNGRITLRVPSDKK
jgi:hypothetical protein